ncbi:DUF1972 domain-containing protein [Vibrio chagasii]|uniref:DUF1972 domain-containing protein n=1 Tax=Vibrio chagasii TaxID=170679 RepID=UPI0033711F09|nr:Alpha-D-GlcNAc alpha-1,2-L-rhamnosyltransferase [Vibrio chagasii]
MKTVAVVGTVGIPACYGGFESLVENLTANASENIKYSVFCSSKSYEEKLALYNGARLIYLPLKANGVQSVPYDILSLVRSLFVKPDVVLILGVSGCIFLPIFRLLSKSKIVTNIDGLEWKRDKWGYWSRKFLKFSEKIAVKFSDVVISDNKAITDYVQSEYGVTSKTIAYGGDHALRDNITPSNEPEYCLALCRIEPENNVSMILRAFSKSERKLKFVGNWDASEFGQKLKSEYSKFDNIEIIDPIYSLDALYKLRASCSLYVHGHSAGGTNPSLVEMMHFAVPILAFNCSFNHFSTESKAEYFASSEQLLQLLNLDNNLEREAIGKRMKSIANENYTWSCISNRYEDVF